MKVAACAKHSPCTAGRRRSATSSTRWSARRTSPGTQYLPAFEAAVKEGEVESVMGAYNRTLGEPCCGSDLLMRKILRGKWGFEGHYVFGLLGDLRLPPAPPHHGDGAGTAALALKMGCDVNCGNTYLHLLQALEAGLITEEDITASAERLFTTRFLLGEFDENCVYNTIPYETVECPEHLALSEEAARRSVVLLKMTACCR